MLGTPPSRWQPLVTATSAALGTTLLWWHWGGLMWGALAGLSWGLLVTAIVAPRFYRPVFRFLDGIIQALLKAFTWAVLAAVYFFLFTPIGLILRWINREPLDRRARTPVESYWQAVEAKREGPTSFTSQS